MILFVLCKKGMPSLAPGFNCWKNIIRVIDKPPEALFSKLFQKIGKFSLKTQGTLIGRYFTGKVQATWTVYWEK